MCESQIRQPLSCPRGTSPPTWGRCPYSSNRRTPYPSTHAQSLAGTDVLRFLKLKKKIMIQYSLSSRMANLPFPAPATPIIVDTPHPL